MKRTLLTLTVAFALITVAAAADHPLQRRKKPTNQQNSQKKSKRVDLVIALDTSGSMDGLLNAARQKLWDIVNEVARAKPTPVLRVGLLTYGSRGSEQDGYVKVRSDLTTDLDAIYSKLFELTTWGGTEYVGRVVHRATGELSWDRNPGTLRQIFVAGNESADQDRTVTSRSAVLRARRKGIFVNAIYCGSRGSSDWRSWQTVATRGRGMFASIDHNRGTVVIATPYDAKINALSAELNRTYVAYGNEGRKRKARQAKQDSNASRVHSGVGAARALAKVSSVYRNAEWDLVDARRDGKLESVRRRGALPAKLRNMNRKELDSYLDSMVSKRKQLRAKIVKLSKKRRAYIATQMKKSGKTADKSFDRAVKLGIRSQARAKGFSF